ncbi:DCC1-like thiol-disulfide oxidoreductase family protein [Streptomyces sp. NPDC007905]|uniref:thiol-disulfide oxidoreductase DCC family protein n=1 Tax=Streptomyces sp. NPDC007905 TaxID=3364788 RepID=UPI0036EE6D07
MSEPVVVFDGACGFCRAAVTRLSRSHRLRLAGRLLPYQGVDLALYGLTEPDAQERMWLVHSGHVQGGAQAFAAWFTTGSHAARLIGRMLTWPGVRHAAEGVYRLIARNRHRIPGPWEGTCAI